MEAIDFNEINIFIKVIQAGSFTKASQELNIPLSTVSTKVTSLEKRLGLTLLQRTTRQLKLTSVGGLYFEKCLEAINLIHEAEENISSELSEPQGVLKVTAPVYLGGLLLPEIVLALNHKYPKLKVELLLNDQKTDFIAEGVDVAIRAGDLKDSSLISKKLGDTYFTLFATSKYLKKFGIPKHPKDLINHKCIHFTALGADQWNFTNGKNKFNYQCKSDLTVNDLSMAEMVALSHLGIVLLPHISFLSKSKKELIQILPEWQIADRPLYLIYPSQKTQSNKTKAFIEVAFEIIQKYIH